MSFAIFSYSVCCFDVHLVCANCGARNRENLQGTGADAVTRVPSILMHEQNSVIFSRAPNDNILIGMDGLAYVYSHAHVMCEPRFNKPTKRIWMKNEKTFHWPNGYGDKSTNLNFNRMPSGHIRIQQGTGHTHLPHSFILNSDMIICLPVHDESKAFLCILVSICQTNGWHSITWRDSTKLLYPFWARAFAQQDYFFCLFIYYC